MAPFHASAPGRSLQQNAMWCALVMQVSLPSVPEAFTRHRLADVHALYTLNKEDAIRKGFMGPYHWQMWAALNNMLLWKLLHKLMPALVSPPVTAFSMVGGKPVSYAHVVSTGYRRFAMSLGTVAAACLAAIAVCL